MDELIFFDFCIVLYYAFMQVANENYWSKIVSQQQGYKSWYDCQAESPLTDQRNSSEYP